ncbi:MAG: SCP2 sterol-binding domain-containing protein [Mycobacterium sp.]
MAKASSTAPRTVRHSLQEIATKVADAKSARAGDIVLRLSGVGGGTYRLSSGPNGFEVSETADVSGTPLIEVIGAAKAVQDILDGKTDARERFLAGGLRVRGDLQYLSDLSIELGILKHPL